MRLEDDQTPISAARLRQRMVEQIRPRIGGDERIAAAMLAICRDRFVPEADLDAAYRVHNAVVTKRDERGLPVSSASAPWLVASMLADADLRPGLRVLEVGAGTGYNAALLQHLVGPSGHVATVDIDPETAARARAALADAGAASVEVCCGDGAGGLQEGAPWDRIVVTTGPGEVAPAWREQLAEGGLLVLALRWRGVWRGMTLRRTGDVLEADSVGMYGFIPMQGSAVEREVDLAGDGRLMLAVEPEHPAIGGEFASALEDDPVVDWTGVVVGNSEDEQGLWTRIACAEPLAGRYTTPLDGSAAVLPHPLPRMWPLALAEPAGGALAYLAGRPAGQDSERFELGVAVLGEDETRLGARLAAHVRDWDAARHVQPRVAVFPADTADEELPRGAVIVDKPSSRMAFTWPTR